MVAFKDADVALLVGARPRGPGMERKDLLEANGKIFAPQGQALDRVANRNVKVLVVGNPANTNCLIAMKNAPSLKPTQFTAMMRLDHNRATSQIAHKIGKPVRRGQESDGVGQPFGDAVSRSVPGRVRRQEGLADDQRPGLAGSARSFPTVQKRGAAIIEARGLSSAASAANAAIDHVRDWVARHAGRRLGQHGHSRGRQLRHRRGRALRLPRDLQGRPSTRSSKASTCQRLQPQAHGRDAEGAARRARRSEAPARRMTPGAKFRQALAAERPLQVIGTIAPTTRCSPKRTGYRAIYLSGGGVAAGSLGMPDLGISNLDDVLIDVRRITDVCDLPLLVDADTGFGASAFNVARTVRSLIKAGAAAMHIEDQVGAKRCGHRPGKELVSRAGDVRPHQGGGGRAHRSRPSWSWRAPTPSPSRDSRRRSSVRRSTWRPAPT